MGIRSIIFRGKRIDDGEWIEGILFNAKEDMFIIPHGNEYRYDELEGLAFDVYGCKVNPSTVGQYTGLVDRNGKKIFEGDIIWLNRRYYKVIYDTLFYAGFCARDLDGDIVSLSRICVEYDVVGNIYDNPNMIGGDQNCLIVKEYTLQ